MFTNQKNWALDKVWLFGLLIITFGIVVYSSNYYLSKVGLSYFIFEKIRLLSV